MAKKNFFEMMLALTLTFGLVLAGCDNGTTDGNGGSNTDTSLNGTWIGTIYGEVVELKLDNGNFESTSQGRLNTKGTYIAENGKITTKTTHIHGGLLELESKWYSQAELKTALLGSGKMTEEEFNSVFGTFSETSLTYTYTVEGNTLKITQEGETATYTKKQ